MRMSNARRSVPVKKPSKKSSKFGKKARTVGEQTDKLEEKTRLLVVETAKFVVEYVEKIKKDPRTYDRSKEGTLDDVARSSTNEARNQR